ncbi:MAG: hypothetical protein V3T30_09365 [Thermodesulfobacteriota bacterium]
MIFKEFDYINDSFTILPDGDIVFDDLRRGECIWRATPGRDNARCALDSNYSNLPYDASVVTAGVSPDGRWLAYVRKNSKVRNPLGGDDRWKEDLFLIELITKEGNKHEDNN